MASLGDISVSIGLDIADLQRNLQRVETELGDLRNSFQNTQREVDNSTGKMAKALGGLMSTFAGNELLGGLSEAVGNILDSTADLQSLDSQYSQVLGKMKGQSDKYLDEMAKKWNKHPNELKNSFMQYDALLKSKGVSEEDAYKLSQEYLERTVDASAFANEDMADTTERFMGGIKGEYDSLDTAMVNLSATMLDQKATEKYGKKFDDLTVTQQETLKVQEALRQHTSAGVFGQGTREADSYQNNLANLKETFKQLEATIGSPIIETVSSVMKDIGKVIKNIADWFGNLPTPVQKFTVVIGIITVAMLGLGLALGGVIIGLGAVAAEIDIGILALAGWVAGIIAAVALLVAIIYLVVKYWDEIKAATITAWNNIIQWLSDTWASIASKASEAWSAVSTAISNALSGLGAWLSNLWNSYFNFVVSIWTKILQAIVSFGLMLYKASGMQAFVDKVVAVWDFLSKTLKITGEMIVAIVKALWSKVKEIASPYVQAFADFVGKIWDGIKSKTSTIFNAVKDFLSKVFGEIKKVISPIISGIKSVITSAWDKVKSTTSTVFGAIKKSASTVWNGIKSVIKTAADGVYSVVSGAFNKVKSAMTKPIDAAKSTISSALSKIKSFFSGLHLKIPAPKLPSISVSKGYKKFLGQEIPYPKFSVHWNAKGAIFDQATLLGGGQGVGEAGAEAVIPIEKSRYMQPFSSAIASQLHELDGDKSSGNVTNKFNISQLVVREDADIQKIAKQLEALQRKQQRAAGKLAY